MKIVTHKKDTQINQKNNEKMNKRSALFLKVFEVVSAGHVVVHLTHIQKEGP